MSRDGSGSFRPRLRPAGPLWHQRTSAPAAGRLGGLRIALDSISLQRDTALDYTSFSFGWPASNGDPEFTTDGDIYIEDPSTQGGEIDGYAQTTSEQDFEIMQDLLGRMGSESDRSLYGPTNCRNWSEGEFDK